LMTSDYLATATAVALCWVLPAAAYFLLSSVTKYELHGYQVDFLAAFAKFRGASGAAAALQSIVMEAIGDESVRAAMYDGFHCVHCGSKDPAPWIKERKGKKEPYALKLSEQAASFLASELLVPVEKLGQPPVRQVVDGARRSDHNKAARVAIDWAIQKYGAVEDGTPRAAKRFAPQMLSLKRGKPGRVRSSPERR